MKKQPLGASAVILAATTALLFPFYFAGRADLQTSKAAPTA
jgi:hypothetical protein